MSTTITPTTTKTYSNGLDVVRVEKGQYTVMTHTESGEIRIGTYTSPGAALAALDASDFS